MRNVVANDSLMMLCRFFYEQQVGKCEKRNCGNQSQKHDTNVLTFNDCVRSLCAFYIQIIVAIAI